MAAEAGTRWENTKPLSRDDQTLLLFARLMEGGQEDGETVQDLGKLTKLLNQDLEALKRGEPSVTAVVDADCVDTIVCYLDMRQPEPVRSHAALCISAYLSAAGEEGRSLLAAFFKKRIGRGTYDDYIVAFCVAATLFPIVPDLTSDMFLAQGLLPSLGPLMSRTWKSRKVETACLNMLNAACMQSPCREAVRKHCTEWLEEIVDQDLEYVIKRYAADPDLSGHEGSISTRRHCEYVQTLAALVLAKLRAVGPRQDAGKSAEARMQQATSSIEQLSHMFKNMFRKDPELAAESCIEGLAYASLQPQVREELSSDGDFLHRLIKTLGEAPPKSPMTYGILTILASLTRYQSAGSEEEKKMEQLQAYANASGKLRPDPLLDREHVAARGRRVFEAGATPVLLSHTNKYSTASLILVTSILHSLSVTPDIRGALAQQGAIRFLIAAWSALPETESLARRTAAQALARILISTNPLLVFGGTRPTPQTSAIRPLLSILEEPDPQAETRDLLPAFESLIALTNLASTDDETRRAIVRTGWEEVDRFLLNNNQRVSTAAVELVCNLVQTPAEAISLYGDGSLQACNRLNVLLALVDAEEEKTRSAAGGALASLTSHESIVAAIVQRARGVENILGLCSDDDEELRHRGAFVVYNMAATSGGTGKLARVKLRAAGGVDILTRCVKKSRRSDVVEAAVQALKMVLEGDT